MITPLIHKIFSSVQFIIISKVLLIMNQFQWKIENKQEKLKNLNQELQKEIAKQQLLSQIYAEFSQSSKNTSQVSSKHEESLKYQRSKESLSQSKVSQCRSSYIEEQITKIRKFMQKKHNLHEKKQILTQEVSLEGDEFHKNSIQTDHRKQKNQIFKINQQKQVNQFAKTHPKLNIFDSFNASKTISENLFKKRQQQRDLQIEEERKQIRTQLLKENESKNANKQIPQMPTRPTDQHAFGFIQIEYRKDDSLRKKKLLHALHKLNSGKRKCDRLKQKIHSISFYS